MALWQMRSKRTPRGGKLKRLRKRRVFERGSEFLETKIGKRKVKVKKGRGGNRKVKLLSVESVNIVDKSGGKTVVSKILSVVANPSNPHYVRRNILTKGTIVKTEAGLARITSRPGQHGTINAILVEEKK